MFHHRRSGVSRHACLTALLVTALAGCGSGDGGGNGNVDNADATQAEANYYTVAPIEFALQGDDGSRPQAAQSSEARVFYSYHPAVGGPVGKPLFVMLNGGPGCATTTNLFSMNTAPCTLDKVRTGPHRAPRDGDRMLAAQARVEDLVLISPDQAFDPYQVPRRWDR